jgi:hypothetical protein
MPRHVVLHCSAAEPLTERDGGHTCGVLTVFRKNTYEAARENFTFIEKINSGEYKLRRGDDELQDHRVVIPAFAGHLNGGALALRHDDMLVILKTQVVFNVGEMRANASDCLGCAGRIGLDHLQTSLGCAALGVASGNYGGGGADYSCHSGDYGPNQALYCDLVRVHRTIMCEIAHMRRSRRRGAPEWQRPGSRRADWRLVYPRKTCAHSALWC